MGLFGFGKKKTNTNTDNTGTVTQQPCNENTYQQQAAAAPLSNTLDLSKEVTLDLTKKGTLNLQKGQFLDLTKTGVNLTDIRVAAGWDVNDRFGANYDLDLCACLLDANGRKIRSGKDVVCYHNKRGPGIRLDQDNLTGEGDGDDENIFVNFSKIPAECHSVVFAVVIYGGMAKGQTFGKVKNAFVRLVDQSVSPERELCRFNLTGDGGKNTACTFARIMRAGMGWTFEAIGELERTESIGTLFSRY